MDTGAMVELASKWRNVPLQHICQSAVMKTDMQVPPNKSQQERKNVTTTRLDPRRHWRTSPGQYDK